MKEPVRYKVICPICNYDFDVARSILMDMGLNLESCNCPNCKTHLHLECNEESKTMNAEDYKLYVDKLKEGKKYEVKITDN